MPHLRHEPGAGEAGAAGARGAKGGERIRGEMGRTGGAWGGVGPAACLPLALLPVRASGLFLRAVGRARGMSARRSPRSPEETPRARYAAGDLTPGQYRQALE